MMDIKPLVLAGIMLVVWVFQIVALAGKDAIVKDGSCGYGLFESDCYGYSDGMVDSKCGDAKDQSSAIAAFGVLSVLIMSFCLMVHTAMAIPPVASKLGALSKFLRFIFVAHFVSAFFLFLCWAICAGMYDQELCNFKLKDQFDLSYGFAFFIINMVGEVVLGVLCMMGWHGGSSSQVSSVL